MKHSLFLLSLLTLALSTSCVSRKSLTYFGGIDSVSPDSINKYIKPYGEARIEAGDEIRISIIVLDSMAAKPFNTGYNYIVDTEGNIEMPILKTVKIGGLQKSEAVAVIKEKLAPYLNEPSVVIFFGNHKITVLGEVNSPGEFSVGERVTIFDALGKAGDINKRGARNKILVVREKDGKIEYGRINLNNANVFASPYYYLRPNDMIYVEPRTGAAVNNGVLPVVGVAATCVTAVSVVYLVLHNTALQNAQESRYAQ
ncbi:MAG: polysaccharide biosynthesis/export family protein [Paludibacter sp.]|jgi:polysaccharide export outer membrane protein|nr:polysaccharide biosynthesis/export family protein [Paludibacter sp.]